MVELSELTDLSDTQDGLRCWRNRIYILWLTSYPCDKISGEGSLVCGHYNFCYWISALVDAKVYSFVTRFLNKIIMHSLILPIFQFR